MASFDAGAALLAVIGEPLAEEQTVAISQRIIEGLSTWDHEKCPVDLNTELLNFINKNVEAELAAAGGCVLRNDASQLYIEFLIAPSLQTLHSSLQNFLTRSAPYKHVIHAGPAFSGTGSWIIQDGTLSFHDFARMLHRPDVGTALKEIGSNATLCVSCFPEGEWTDQGAKHHGLDKYGNISVGIMHGTTSVEASCAVTIQRYIDGFVQYPSLRSLMPKANLVGSIRFRHPTIYVFPAGQGDAALFGVDGFLMVLDGGFQKKTCFWDFLSHVDHLDAILISRINSANAFGAASFLELLASTGCAPKLGHAFGNIPEIGKAPVGQEKSPLLMSLYEEGAKIHDHLSRLGLKSQTCAYVPALVTAKHPESITLYEKVGQGRLEMYVLNPLKESKEYAEFVDTWKKRAPKLIGYKFSTNPGSDTADYSIPLTNRASLAVLIVWRPADPNERIVRVLYPGSCPQEKILNGLEKLKSLDILKYPYCNGSLLEKKLTAVAGMKAALLSKKPSGGKTAAELLAEGAKMNSVVAKPAIPGTMPSNSSIGRRETPLTSPPTSSPTPMQSQSPSQILSPHQDSDLDIGNTENGNGSETRFELDSAPLEQDTDVLQEHHHNHHRAGYNVDEEPGKACAYEAVDIGAGDGASVATMRSPNGAGVGEYGDGGPPPDGEILEKRDNAECAKEGAALCHSSLNPNAQPFYPKFSESSSDSSPETVRRADHLQGGDADSTGEVHANEKDADQDKPAPGLSSGNRWNMEDVRNEWGDPLGLPTLPNKKEPATTPKTSGPAKPASKQAQTAPATKNAAAKLPARASQRDPLKATAAKASPLSPSSKTSPSVTATANAKLPKKPTSEPTRKLSTAAAKPVRPVAGVKKSMASVAPCYVDLVYVPHNGNPSYCNVDFFKCIRSKFYVISSLNPPKETLDAFLLGKKSWNCQEEMVTIIPTYDSDTLSLWMGLHKDELALENIDVAPSCSRCSVNLEEPAGATCAAYRLEL